MDLQLTPEQTLIRDTAPGPPASHLAPAAAPPAAAPATHIAPAAAQIDREHRFPRELVAKLAELGLMGVAVPEAWGGAGMDTVSYALALEEISRACASTGVIMSVQNSLVCDPILTFGSDDQRTRWLPGLACGKQIGCFALSEPEAGSDAAAQRTTAAREGDRWVVNG